MGGFSDFHTLILAKKYMKGSALRWYTSTAAQEARNWTVTEFATALYLVVFPEDHHEKMRSKFLRMRQDEQDIRSFATDLRTMARRLPELTDREIRDVFWKGVDGYIRIHWIKDGLSCDKSGLDVLEKLAIRYENARRQERVEMEQQSEYTEYAGQRDPVQQESSESEGQHSTADNWSSEESNSVEGDSEAEEASDSEGQDSSPDSSSSEENYSDEDNSARSLPDIDAMLNEVDWSDSDDDGITSEAVHLSVTDSEDETDNEHVAESSQGAAELPSRPHQGMEGVGSTVKAPHVLSMKHVLEKQGGPRAGTKSTEKIKYDKAVIKGHGDSMVPRTKHNGPSKEGSQYF